MLWVCFLALLKKRRMGWAYCSGAEFIPDAMTSPNQKLSFGSSIAYSVDYAHRLSSGKAALFLEFPFAAALSHRVESAQSTPLPAWQRYL